MNLIAATKRRFPWKRVVVALIVWAVAGVVGTAGSVAKAIQEERAYDRKLMSSRGRISPHEDYPGTVRWYTTRDGTRAWKRKFGEHRDGYASFITVPTLEKAAWLDAPYVHASTNDGVDTGSALVEHTVRDFPNWWPAAYRVAGIDVIARSYGWPVRSLAYIIYVERDAMRAGMYGRLNEALHSLLGLNVSRPIPSIIMPYEFTLNVLFWGSLPALTVLFFPTARSAIRRRRGRCPGCNYDLRGLPASAPGGEGRGAPVCPECGGALAASRIMPAVDRPIGNEAGPAPR